MTNDIQNKIIAIYNLSIPITITKIEKGFSSINYKIETQDQVFFLKKHRASGTKRIETIEKAEQFFADNNIPVVSPVKNITGDLHVVIDNTYYVIYPFVSGISYELGNIPKNILGNMGAKLAEVHLLTKDGIVGEYSEDKQFKLPNKENVLSEIENLLNIINPKNDFDNKVLEGLNLKKQLIKEYDIGEEKFVLKDRHLCLGDYYPDNIFFDENGDILYIFDLDMAGSAPRLFELIRSCMLSCFWYKMNDENIEKAKVFIGEYYKRYPFDLNDFEDTLELFYVKSIYAIWREKAYYIENDNRTNSIYIPSLETIIYLRDNRYMLFSTLSDYIKSL